MAMILTLLSGCEDPPPPAPLPLPVEIPKTVEIPQMAKEGSRVEYVVEMEARKTSNFQKKSQPSMVEFGLIFDVQRQPDGQLAVIGNISYVVIGEYLVNLLFTWDTRNPVAEMEDTNGGESILIHPGLAFSEHPLNAAMPVLKHITKQSFEIKLNSRGGYAGLKDYPSLDDLSSSLRTLDKEAQPAKEKRLSDMLGVFAPQEIESFLCLMLPSRERQFIDGIITWRHDCPINKQLEVLGLHKERYIDEGPDVHYESRKFLLYEDGTYQLNYSAALGDWLQTSDLEIIRNHRKTLHTKQAGPIAISNTVNTKFRVREVSGGAMSSDGSINVAMTGKPGPYILYK